MERDVQLDMYRSFAMIYVLCVTHVLYWLQIGKEPLNSIVLIEMPIIFFISGASLQFAREKSIWESIVNRFRRVVIPYYIYALVLVGFISIFSILFYIESVLFVDGIGTMFRYNITKYTITDVLNIVFINNISQAHFVFHLWFIVPYLILSCTFGFQVRLINKTNKFVYIFLCMVVFEAVNHFSTNSLLRHLTTYNLFMVAGYLLYKRVSIRFILVMALLSFLLLVVTYWGGGG